MPGSKVPGVQRGQHAFQLMMDALFSNDHELVLKDGCPAPALPTLPCLFKAALRVAPLRSAALNADVRSRPKQST